jgi:mono/diheme cytochrome c family protein
VPEEAKAVPNPVPSSPQAVNRGQTLFQRHCTPCHGPKGRGDGPVSSYWKELPKDLGDPARQDRLTDGEIFWKLSKGHRQGADVIMPAFAERLPSAEDRWKIVLFVRTLRAATAKP